MKLEQRGRTKKTLPRKVWTKTTEIGGRLAQDATAVIRVLVRLVDGESERETGATARLAFDFN